jgi:hypothetical protein
LIGEECFCECRSLCEITFESESRLRGIEKGAFSRSGVKRIQIPSSVGFIGKECFRGCRSLREVIFEGEVKEIGSDAFENCQIDRIVIPRGVTMGACLPEGCRIEYRESGPQTVEPPKPLVAMDMMPR